MSGVTRRLDWLWAIAVGGVCTFSSNYAVAQIIPDGTLPNNSIVTPPTDTAIGRLTIINGGTQAGSNLFHSFEMFSIPTNSVTLFNNAVAIQNIISRVTGRSVSNIDGILATNGTANLFLINPSGIIFGPNTSVFVGGSFVATTANAVQFGNQGIFSASNPQASSPLLTVNPSALLFNQVSVAPIQFGLQASTELAPNSAFTPIGLFVPEDKSLLLVGGDINIDGGTLFAFGGRVELGGLAEQGSVELLNENNNLRLNFPENVARASVSFTNRAIVDATNGGSITVNARNLDVLGGSIFIAGTGESLGAVDNQVGDITLNATGEIKVVGSSILNVVQPQTSGNGGDITINTQRLQVQDGGIITTTTFGTGKGGNITVTATDKVQIIGSSPGTGASILATGVDVSATGNSGDLTINTPELLVSDGGIVSTSTLGAGNGGNLTVNTQQLLVQNTGAVTTGTLGSGNGGDLTVNTQQFLVQDEALIATATTGMGHGGNLIVNSQQFLVQNRGQVNTGTISSGHGGNLTVNTQQFAVQNGGVVSASTLSTGHSGTLTVSATDKIQLTEGSVVTNATFDVGRGGNLTINTAELLVQDGSAVSTSTFGAGNSGNLTVTADNIQLIGTSDGSQLGSSLQLTQLLDSDLLTNTELDLTSRLISTSVGSQFRSGLFATAEPNSTGTAGNLTINTQQLFVQDGAGVFVRSQGTGTAGNLTIDARSIRLDNQATLTADTRSNSTNLNREQATITLRTGEFLLLQGSSSITTSATGSNVIGGNINIDTNFLITSENSDIRANSTDFRGGRVTINANGIFGTQFQDTPTLESDITATGGSPELGGTVEVNTSPVDFGLGLVELPVSLADAGALIASSCADFDNTTGSNFTVTGRGGLPPSPDEPLTNDIIWTDTRIPTITAPQPETADLPSPKNHAVAVIPATGWVFNGKGEVTLISASNTATLGNTNAACGGLK